MAEAVGDAETPKMELLDVPPVAVDWPKMFGVKPDMIYILRKRNHFDERICRQTWIFWYSSRNIKYTLLDNISAIPKGLQNKTMIAREGQMYRTFARVPTIELPRAKNTYPKC